jgi:holliday junction DNA helicase RuvA
MIASISGRVQDITQESIVIDVGGVGYQVFIPIPLRDRLHTGETVFIYTFLVVRQDALNLFGFESREGRDLFILLLSVNGVGPKLALAILSTLTPDTIKRAVFQEQAEIFSRVPGVGKKTAQKILLQLQDRIPVVAGLGVVSALNDVDTEVLDALTALGYSVVEAQAALQYIPKDTPQDVETRLRMTLKYFSP